MGWNFNIKSKYLKFYCQFAEFWGKFTFFINTELPFNDHLFVFITSDYVIAFWLFHLRVVIQELTQSKSALNERCSALKTQRFRAKKINAEQLWFGADFLWYCAEFFRSEQRWFRENQSWSALTIFMFSESALKKVKFLKQRCCLALIILGFQPGLPSLTLHSVLLDVTISRV